MLGAYNPTYLVTKIWDVICNDDQRIDQINVIGPHDIGKSYPLLYRTLYLRKYPEDYKTRVVYINNSDDFLINFSSYVISEIMYAIGYDLPQLNQTENKIKIIRNATADESFEDAFKREYIKKL